MNNRRIGISLMTGALLGILCIIGVGLRMGFAGNDTLLLSLWYNRVLMGFVIGISSKFKIIKSNRNYLVRGPLIGFFISLAHSLTSGFVDIPSFFAGIAYGIIIDFLATRYG